MQYQKAKSAHKNVIPNGSYLRKKVLDTSSIIASVVGGTLGPGGHPVLIEREEHGLPPDITKDGVTVIRSLGFKDSASHVLMEAERDAAVRTAATAGDGTTTATILSDAFLRRVMKFCDSNKNYSPQAVVRDIQKTYAEVFEPSIRDLTLRGDLSTPEGRKRLAAVATVSANGDTELADAVLEAYDICGDDGNVTILEASGKVSSIEVREIPGFPIGMGYEESLQHFFPVFINRPDLQMVRMEKPAFLLYFGQINEMQVLLPLLEKLQDAYRGEYLKTHNIVVVATGFSTKVLASLAVNWSDPNSINVLPFLVPNKNPIHNAAKNFIDDLAAVVGAEVYDPVVAPLDLSLIHI
jgi:chaperonin GroEL